MVLWSPLELCLAFCGLLFLAWPHHVIYWQSDEKGENGPAAFIQKSHLEHLNISGPFHLVPGISSHLAWPEWICTACYGGREPHFPDGKIRIHGSGVFQIIQITRSWTQEVCGRVYTAIQVLPGSLEGNPRDHTYSLNHIDFWKSTVWRSVVWVLIISRQPLLCPFKSDSWS